jgi:hypothetical protein
MSTLSKPPRYELNINVCKGNIVCGNINTAIQVMTTIDGHIVHKTEGQRWPATWNAKFQHRCDTLEPVVPVLITFSLYRKRFTTSAWKLVGSIHFSLQEFVKIVNLGVVEQEFNVIMNRKSLITFSGSIKLQFDLIDHDTLRDSEILKQQSNDHIHSVSNNVSHNICQQPAELRKTCYIRTLPWFSSPSTSTSTSTSTPTSISCWTLTLLNEEEQHSQSEDEPDTVLPVQEVIDHTVTTTEKDIVDTKRGTCILVQLPSKSNINRGDDSGDKLVCNTFERSILGFSILLALLVLSSVSIWVVCQDIFYLHGMKSSLERIEQHLLPQFYNKAAS